MGTNISSKNCKSYVSLQIKAVEKCSQFLTAECFDGWIIHFHLPKFPNQIQAWQSYNFYYIFQSHMTSLHLFPEIKKNHFHGMGCVSISCKLNQGK